MRWEVLSIERIIGGTSPDGVPLLQLFLNDYKNKFNKDSVNAGCPSCLRQYHDDWVNKIREMENTCKYKLHPKYEGIQLDPMSNVFVTNANITDEMGAKLLARRGERIFVKFPKAEEKKKEANTIVEPARQAPKPKRKPRKKKS